MALRSTLKFRDSFLRIPVSRHIHLQSAAMKSKNFIPDRWIDYIPVGKRIPGTRFIAFKVPLKNIYDGKLAPWQRFSPSDLVNDIKKQNEELGLVVDLTCTQRYYSPQELPKTILYSKIFTVGHAVPSDQVIAQFKHIVNKYLSENSGNEKLVGVHCTHGLNRTGYLVCRYLIDMLRMEPSEAIEKFNSSRGHSIERSNYLEDLLHGNARSNAGLDDHEAKNQKTSSRNTANPKQPPYPEERPRSHGGAGLDYYQANNRQHLSRRNANSPPCAEEQPRSQSHTHEALRWGPMVPGSRYAHPPLHHAPLQMMGPQRGFPHYSVRHPSHDPRTPSPGFPRPRHSLQMEDHPPHHYRGPSRPQHYLPRHFPHHGGFKAVNGATPQDCSPDVLPHSEHSPGYRFPAPPHHSQQHHSNSPYQRQPSQVHTWKPKKQWQ
ncbi:uncharacterized protein ACNLHF_016138 [Anomaloglossus baeobatrachus]|uniref:uncharacterized protein LOC142304095 n=1 Tax=Anomaloglossus baeobatrachus TaxID=238106 RepID=UPI003F509BE7